MRIRFLISACCIILSAACFGCGGGSVPSFDELEKLTLYSIDGRDFEPGTEPKVEERFHGYSVLGKVEVKDLDKRKEVLAALKEGMAHSDGTMANASGPDTPSGPWRKGEPLTM